jgi:hypothetical protein
MTEQALIEVYEDSVFTETVDAEGQVDIFPGPVIVPLSVDTMEFFEIDTVGPQGPPGAPGPAGATYVHNQTSAGATWTIIHPLNTIPSLVLMIDSLPGEPVVTDISYPDLNTVIVEWPSAESGKAYLK